MSAKGSFPPLTCMRPSSAQRCSVGKTLPGLSSCSGSKAHFTRSCCARSTSLNIVGIRSRFSTPTPCSPVSTPPTSTHSFRISAPNSSALSSSPGTLASGPEGGPLLLALADALRHRVILVRDALDDADQMVDLRLAAVQLDDQQR